MENTLDLIEYCKKHNLSLSQLALKREMEKNNSSKEDIFNNLYKIIDIMENSIKKHLKESKPSLGGLIGYEAELLHKYSKKKNTFLNSNVLHSMAGALSTSQVNACMGKIVAAPTAGASGILPAIIFHCKDKFDLDYEEMAMGLLTSSLIGEIIALKATLSGAEGGCQAECGSASAMAAAACVELAGGSPEEAFHAASLALTNVMGLICDPIAGLVEYPCSIRNASGVSNAFVSADMALAGIKSIIPFDQVVESMKLVGDLMNPSLKETALGGLAATEKAKELEKNILR